MGNVGGGARSTARPRECQSCDWRVLGKSCQSGNVRPRGLIFRPTATFEPANHVNALVSVISLRYASLGLYIYIYIYEADVSYHVIFDYFLKHVSIESNIKWMLFKILMLTL